MPPKKQSGKRTRKKYDDDSDYDDNDTATFDDDFTLSKASRKKKNEKKADEGTTITSDDRKFRDFSHLSLKSDHISRPIWVTPAGSIFLEAFSPIYQQAYDFLVAVAEPVSRPEHIHEYRLTSYSLYAAVAVSIDTESIINVLQRLCKTELPIEVSKFIRECTSAFGKAKLVLKDNRFFVESYFPDVLRVLLRNPFIASSRIIDDQQLLLTDTAQNSSTDGFITDLAPTELKQNLDYLNIGRETLINDMDDGCDLEDDVVAGADVTDRLRTVSFMVKQEHVQVCSLAIYIPNALIHLISNS